MASTDTLPRSLPLDLDTAIDRAAPILLDLHDVRVRSSAGVLVGWVRDGAGDRFDLRLPLLDAARWIDAAGRQLAVAVKIAGVGWACAGFLPPGQLPADVLP